MKMQKCPHCSEENKIYARVCSYCMQTIGIEHKVKISSVGNWVIVFVVVVVLFLAGLDNTTIPIQMWTGLREQLSPTILAVATCLIIMSTLVLVNAEFLRRRSERIRGIRN